MFDPLLITICLLNLMNFLINLSKCYFNDTQDGCFKSTIIHAAESHSSHSTTTRESSSLVPISDYNTYDKASSPSYITQEITVDTNSSRRFGFDTTKTPKSHEDFTASSSNPAVLIKNPISIWWT
ncbi:hypothetical protein BD770DRAFT_428041 [Pilaira anomala]|nr:hypothetical protein BD770DRAFT_428041 [Pilaira anomala]